MEAATQAKEYCDAWKICNEAFHRFPGSARVYGARGYLECEQGRYEALADFHESLRLDPEYSYAINDIKNLCQKIGADNIIDTAVQKKQKVT